MCVCMLVSSVMLAPLSIGFSRQAYWRGLPCPHPRDLPDPGIEPVSFVAPALQADSSVPSHRGSPYVFIHTHIHTFVLPLLSLYSRQGYFFKESDHVSPL